MFQLPVRHASGHPAASSLFSGNLHLTKEIERLPEYLPDPPRERDAHERPRAYEAKNESSRRRRLWRALGHGSLCQAAADDDRPATARRASTGRTNRLHTKPITSSPAMMCIVVV